MNSACFKPARSFNGHSSNEIVIFINVDIYNKSLSLIVGRATFTQTAIFTV